MGDEDMNGDGEYTIRRSTRRKRPRDDWESEIVMKVRQSRTSGDSESITVKSRGGQPAHRQKNDQVECIQDTLPGKPKFCKECGWRHEVGRCKILRTMWRETRFCKGDP